MKTGGKYLITQYCPVLPFLGVLPSPGKLGFSSFPTWVFPGGQYFANLDRVCTVFILSKTYSTCVSSKFPQVLPWLLVSALYSSFQILTQHQFVSNISTKLAMSVWVCTVFILSKTYSTCVSSKFPQVLPWLLVSALYSSFQILIQHQFVSNISTKLAMSVWVCTVFTFQRLIQLLFVSKITVRLAMTVGVCTVFILSKTYSTSVCQQHFHKTCHDCCTVFILSKTYSTSVCHQHFHKTCHDCWSLHCINPFKDLFNICLSPTFLQGLK